MAEKELEKRFCKFELCTHRNGEGICCLYNQDNCIFHRLEKENAELGERIISKKGAEFGYNKANEQLVKAKEIIKYLCEMVRELNKPNPQFFNVEYSLQETEQFLKEI